VYSDQTQIAVTYVDEDDENVLVSSHDELKEAFKVRIDSLMFLTWV